MTTDRRSVMLASAAASLLATYQAAAREASALSVNPRGNVGILRRLPRLDLESQHDFLIGQKIWQGTTLARAGQTQAQEILKANGVDPDADTPLATVLPLFANDPVISLSGRTFLEVQRLKFTTLRNEFHANADAYFAELEAADKAGPGSLELNPKMHVPDYCRHEIHTQLGGYVGDPFAGYIYNYGTNVFFNGRNDQDELYEAFAKVVPVPADRRVRRILDLGAGAGQLATSLKKRFPDAEIWAIDVAGPMIRYGHMRANEMGVAVNFAQRLGEDSKFPADHFDIVTSYIMFHEVTAQAAARIIAETERILRPGGVFYPIDFYTGGAPPARPLARYTSWWDHRWNNEVWRMEYAALDFAGAMRQARFTVKDGPPAELGRGKTNVMGVKA
jgi:ubiquinone/menaquinone biosynthesis C-methylase UbiE